MTNNAASNQQLEPCPFCGVVPTMQSHTQEDEMDDGRYVFFVECGNGKCPMGLVSTGGPYRSQADAAKRWNTRSRFSAGGVVATDDEAGLSEYILGFCPEKGRGNAILSVEGELTLLGKQLVRGLVARRAFNAGKFPDPRHWQPVATASPATPKEES